MSYVASSRLDCSSCGSRQGACRGCERPSCRQLVLQPRCGPNPLWAVPARPLPAGKRGGMSNARKDIPILSDATGAARTDDFYIRSLLLASIAGMLFSHAVYVRQPRGVLGVPLGCPPCNINLDNATRMRRFIRLLLETPKALARLPQPDHKLHCAAVRKLPALYLCARRVLQVM
jgi:hypothetical protein